MITNIGFNPHINTLYAIFVLFSLISVTTALPIFNMSNADPQFTLSGDFPDTNTYWACIGSQCGIMASNVGSTKEINFKFAPFCISQDIRADLTIKNATDTNWVLIGQAIIDYVPNTAAITGFSPSSGITWGGIITMIGVNFDRDMVVSYGQEPYKKAQWNFVDEKTVTFTIYDILHPGKLAIHVSNNGGCEFASRDYELKAIPFPDVTSITPNHVPIWGAQDIAVTWTDVGATLSQVHLLTVCYSTISKNLDTDSGTIATKILSKTSGTASLPSPSSGGYGFHPTPGMIMSICVCNQYEAKGQCMSLRYDDTVPPNTAVVLGISPDHGYDNFTGTVTVFGRGFAKRVSIRFAQQVPFFVVIDDGKLTMSIQPLAAGLVPVSASNNGLDFSSPVFYKAIRTPVTCSMHSNVLPSGAVALQYSFSGSVIGGTPPYTMRVAYTPSSTRVPLLSNCTSDCYLPPSIVTYSVTTLSSTTGLPWVAAKLSCLALWGGNPFMMHVRDASGAVATSKSIVQHMDFYQCQLDKKLIMMSPLPKTILSGGLVKGFKVNMEQRFGGFRNVSVDHRLSVVAISYPSGLPINSTSTCIKTFGSGTHTFVMSGPPGTYVIQLVDVGTCAASKPHSIDVVFNDGYITLLLTLCSLCFLAMVITRVLLLRYKGKKLPWSDIASLFSLRFRLRKLSNISPAWRAHNRIQVGCFIVTIILAIVGMSVISAPEDEAVQLPGNLGRLSIAWMGPKGPKYIADWLTVITSLTYLGFFIVAQLCFSLSRKIAAEAVDEHSGIRARSLILRKHTFTTAAQILEYIKEETDVETASIWVCVKSVPINLLKSLDRYGPAHKKLIMLEEEVKRSIETTAKQGHGVAVLTFPSSSSRNQVKESIPNCEPIDHTPIDLNCSNLFVSRWTRFFRVVAISFVLLAIILVLLVVFIQLQLVGFGGTISSTVLQNVPQLKQYVGVLTFVSSLQFLKINLGAVMASVVGFVLLNFVLMKLIASLSRLECHRSVSGEYGIAMIRVLFSAFCISILIPFVISVFTYVLLMFLACASPTMMFHWLLSMMAGYIIQTGTILPTLRIAALTVSPGTSYFWKRVWWLLSGGIVMPTKTRYCHPDREWNKHVGIEESDEASGLPISLYANEALVICMAVTVGPSSPLLFLLACGYFLIAVITERHFLLSGAYSGVSKQLGSKILRNQGYTIVVAIVISALFNIILITLLPESSTINDAAMGEAVVPLVILCCCVVLVGVILVVANNVRCRRGASTVKSEPLLESVNRNVGGVYGQSSLERWLSSELLEQLGRDVSEEQLGLDVSEGQLGREEDIVLEVE